MLAAPEAIAKAVRPWACCLLSLLCLSCGQPDGPAPQLLLLGDTAFGESYRAFPAARAYEHSLARFAPLLADAGMALANLETPVTDIPASPYTGVKRYLHYADPEKTPRTLAANRIGYVSLANNHTLDYGIAGLEQTLSVLAAAGVHGFGAGADESSAALPLGLELRAGDRVVPVIIATGFEYRRGYDTDYAFYARTGTGGVNEWTAARASGQISGLRESSPQAFIIAWPHFGKNYAWKTGSQQRLARALIDAGADLVVGHGAHVFQEIETYAGRWIIYNLGNFVFNSPGRYGRIDIHPYSLIAGLDVVNRDGRLEWMLRLYPILSDNLVTGYQPRYLRGPEFARARQVLLAHSDPAGRLDERLRPGVDRYGRYLALDVTPGDRP